MRLKTPSFSVFGGTTESRKSEAMQSMLTAAGAEAERTASTLPPFVEKTAAVSLEKAKNILKIAAVIPA